MWSPDVSGELPPRVINYCCKWHPRPWFYYILFTPEGHKRSNCTRHHFILQRLHCVDRLHGCQAWLQPLGTLGSPWDQKKKSGAVANANPTAVRYFSLCISRASFCCWHMLIPDLWSQFQLRYCLKVAVARPRWRVYFVLKWTTPQFMDIFGNFEQVQSYLETMGWKVSDKGKLAMVLKIIWSGSH